MNKYDVALDLESDNSLSIIVRNILPNSTILEFGPATGRLTKYLKEQLNCKIHIVEIDKDAYDESLKYAEDGSCGDIEKYQWAEKFGELKFDYIIFADVLEHLRDPDKVVKAAKKFLKTDGVLIVSVPNIAHDSIIVNLFEDVFQYNKIGLLDDTHVHFFTYNSLKPLFENNGYSIIREEATYLKDDIGEFPFSINETNEEVKEALVSHQYGHVYQLVFFAVKSEDYAKKEENYEVIKNITPKNNNEIFELYVDTGTGFAETDKLIAEVTPGYNKIKFNLINFNEIQELRLDFNESGNCVVTIESIIIDGKSVDVLKMKGNHVLSDKNKYYFNNTDPNIFLELRNIKELEIEFSLKKISTSGWVLIEEFDLLNKYEEVMNNSRKNEKARKECEDSLQKANYQLMVKRNQYNNIVNSKTWKITKPIRKSIMIAKKILKH